MSARIAWIAARGGPLRGDLRVPGDKSISHRALMLAAIAEGTSRIGGFLEGEDTRATAAILRQLGVRIEAPADGERVVHGVGLHGLRGSADRLDCGNAGTGMRLLCGLLAGQDFACELVGDESLSRRPMGRVIEPLTRMGASIAAADGGRPPLRIAANKALRGIDYELPVASAQVKSAVLFAGLYAQGTTRVHESQPTRDYTESMLAAFGWPIRFRPGHAELEGGHRLRALDIVVPGDFSSAAFLIVAACIVPGSDVLIREVGINRRRTGLLAALRAMGADIVEENPRRLGGEAVADLRVRHADLHGIEVPPAIVADMIDEFPALFVAAALAEGPTVVRGAAELRVKESDRIAGMATGLHALGVRVDETPDGAIIHGLGAAGRLRSAQVDSRGDHRLAMAFAVAAQRADGQARIADCANVATSFPGFMALANSFGMSVQAHPATDS
ncbi:MAG: 3-phosphoshikimate 1-carboxyvinyltransferase [Proteobacteria bacterium]|nr:3-phosphoshikimate 1-carboxyvinyltransferase [Pseudomonadota bacterium]